jgi:indolepyruvate ferredoxin oxidoreductase alpha subunit
MFGTGDQIAKNAAADKASAARVKQAGAASIGRYYSSSDGKYYKDFDAAKKAKPKDVIYPTDIGCYTLGRYKPLEMADLLLCMGSNAGTACGLAIATDQKIISFMGDSTFFHAAIPAIIDAAHHNHDLVITILDLMKTVITK